MSETHAKRKLTAIFSADVKGYSLLMADDEEATVRTISAYREVMTGLIKDHRGRVVDAKGDNVLAEFSSVVEAVRCAVQIQKELRDKNSVLPEHRRMEFRMGINLGDVIEEQGTIYGDGVNVAARLEGTAEGGGICISGSAFEQVKGKLKVGYEHLGAQTVKNIAEKVSVYRVLMEPESAGSVSYRYRRDDPRRKRSATIAALVIVILGVAAIGIWNFYRRAPKIEPASASKMAFPLPNKPSIVVLPFVNMSEDPKQEFFSDGLTEEIITAISKSPNLFVIARNSAFTYKGKPVKTKQVSEDLGVRYVLEGSVRREGEKIRIAAQLIDAMSGRYIWSDRFDRDLRDILALQEEIAVKIMKALQVRLPSGDRGGSTGRGTKSVEAYLRVMEAAQLLFRYTKEDNAVARKLLEDAIRLDPDYSRAYSVLGVCLINDVVILRTSKSPKQDLARAIEIGQKSLTLDESDAHTNSLVAYLYAMTRQFDRGVVYAEKALALDPNSFSVLNNSGFVLTFSGKPEQAIPLVEKAIRLDPFASIAPYMVLNMAYLLVGRYQDALEPAKKAVERNPRFLIAQIRLAIACSLTGRDEDARAAAAEILKIDPRFSIEDWARTFPIPIKDQSYIDRFADALRKAGLPDKPPLPLPDEPSIAVLPFVNMSEDKSQEYFSDGLTEEIITALSKTPKIFVIARNSTFTYKGKPVKVQQVGRELGVKHVLEGSVRKADNQVRITAQLVDAQTGHHLWAERYDRELKDIFAVQDEITKKIIAALQVELTQGEQARVYERGTHNLEAYLKVMQAAEFGRRFNQKDNIKARRLAEEAIALDPTYASAYREMGAAYAREVWLRIANSPRASLQKAAKLTEKALLLDESLTDARTLLGQVYLLFGDFEKAIAEGQRATEIDPNGAESHWFLGMAFVFAGRAEEAIQSLEKALRLNPFAPSHYFHMRALSHWYLGQYEAAIEWGQKAVRLSPENQPSQAILTMSYSSAGHQEDAQAQAAKLLKINPGYCIKQKGEDRFKDPEANERFRNALRKAGIPDCPSN